MHYKITIFGACAPYPRLIYWIALSISQGEKDDMSSKSGPDYYIGGWVLKLYKYPGSKGLQSSYLTFTLVIFKIHIKTLNACTEFKFVVKT